MRVDELPVVQAVVNAGPDDSVFDALLLAGPLVLLVVALAGRSVVTEALAAGYLLAFVGYVLYLGFR